MHLAHKEEKGYFREMLNLLLFMFMTISIKKTKELLGNRNLPEGKIEEIRNSMRSLAEVIFSQWDSERKSQKNYKTNKS